MTGMPAEPPPRPEPTDPAEIYFRKAWQLRKEKRYPEAAEALRQSLAHDPDKAPTHFNLAWIYDQLGRSGEALAHARKALELFEREGHRKQVETAARFLIKLGKKYGVAGD